MISPDEVFFRHMVTGVIYRLTKRHPNQKGIIASPVLFPCVEKHIPNHEVGGQLWPTEDGSWTETKPEGYID